jgi:ankyrin repeat protein
MSAASVISTLAMHGDADRVVSLLARHPTTHFAPSCRDASGRSPLHYAIGSATATQAIAAHCAPALLAAPDCAGLSPLHYAVARGRLDVARALLDARAPVNVAVADADARAPLHLAAASAHAAMLALLLDAGAAVGVADAHGATALHYLAAADPAAVAESALLACLALLLERGAFLDARDELGETPLHWAARSASPTAVRLLLDAGADPGAISVDLESPLYIAGVAKRSAILAAAGSQGDAEAARAQRCETLVGDAIQRAVAAKKPMPAPAVGNSSANPTPIAYTFV